MMDHRKRILFFWVLCLLSCGIRTSAGRIVLCDFEDGVNGWENEADHPVEAVWVKGRARRGERTVGFTHRFTSKTRLLHCRVTQDFPKDCSDPAFMGFSAWIFIPNGKPYWEIKMFARSGPDWTWGEGKALGNLEPGWHRVEILRGQIAAPGTVQDIGVQVLNWREEITSQILIDDVQMLKTGIPSESP